MVALVRATRRLTAQRPLVRRQSGEVGGGLRKLLRRHLKAAVREAVALARKNHRETCGLLIDSGYAIELVSVRNTARRPGHFVFDARQVRALQRAARLLGHEVLGTYHSHPVSPARPGLGDIEGTLNDSLMLIIDCIEREARLWYIHDGKARSVRYECVGS